MNRRLQECLAEIRQCLAVWFLLKTQRRVCVKQIILSAYMLFVCFSPAFAFAVLPVCASQPDPSQDEQAHPFYRSKSKPNPIHNLPLSISEANQPVLEVLDMQSVSAEQPRDGIKTISPVPPARTISCDILIAGGGIGGVAAALTICRLQQSNRSKHLRPLKIVLTEETDWLGGQLTAQGVCALDENYLVETTGAGRQYQRLRSAIRDYYTTQCQLSARGQAAKYLNPGSCWVSSFACEPKIALSVLRDFLKPSIDDGTLKVLLRHKIYKVNHGLSEVSRNPNLPNVLKTAYAVCLADGQTVAIKPKLCLDATEFGDLLALQGIDYSLGSDSRGDTGEPYAPSKGNSENVQDFTFPFVLTLDAGTARKVEKPAHYEEFKDQHKFTLAGYKLFETVAGNPPLFPFWQYRRLIDASNFANSSHKVDLSLINWLSNDLRGFNVIDQPPAVQAQRLALGKSLSLGFLYWLNNEAPRDEGGKGYPELVLDKEALGTVDGIAKHPYVREARRAKTLHTITEQEIIASYNAGARAHNCPDSVGIGFYPIDVHGVQEVRGTWQATKPFQIPLGAMLCRVNTNLLPASKNIGTTHLTNGAYRLHPIEWAIGEAQGALAFFALSHNTRPQDTLSTVRLLRQLQESLVLLGTPIFWYDDVPTYNPHFAAIQYLSVCDILTGNEDNLHFEPKRPITRAACAMALAKLILQSPLTATENRFGNKVSDLQQFQAQAPAIEACLTKALMTLDKDNKFRPADPLSIVDWQAIRQHPLLKKKDTEINDSADAGNGDSRTLVTREDFAEWLYKIATTKRYFGRL